MIMNAKNVYAKDEEKLYVICNDCKGIFEHANLKYEQYKQLINEKRTKTIKEIVPDMKDEIVTLLEVGDCPYCYKKMTASKNKAVEEEE